MSKLRIKLIQRIDFKRHKYVRSMNYLSTIIGQIYRSEVSNFVIPSLNIIFNILSGISTEMLRIK